MQNNKHLYRDILKSIQGRFIISIQGVSLVLLSLLRLINNFKKNILKLLQMSQNKDFYD